MLQIKIFPVNPLSANCIVFWEDAGKVCAVADPGFYRKEEEEAVLSFLRENSLTPDSILLTHGHFDHTWGAASLAKRFGCPVYMNPADDSVLHFGSSLLDRLQLRNSVELFDYLPVADGDTLSSGGCSWQVITTPGHTPGSVCLICEDALFSGDTLFRGSCGRTDFPDGNYEDILRSLGRLGRLEGDYRVLPGHEETTGLDFERRFNPYLRQGLSL